jgi:D-alanyl-D-alanine carboxypeptidase (penicillin-binding protein 5/6)
MSWGFNAWQSKPLYKAGTKVGEAQVQMGGDDEVALVAPHDLAVTYPAGLTIGGGPKIAIRYNGPIMAPIAKGQHIADLVVTTATGEQVMPLVAAEAVGQAGFFGRAWLGLKQLIGMA